MENKNNKPKKKPQQKPKVQQPIPAPIEKSTQEVNDLEVAKKMLKIYQSASDRSLEFNLSLESVRKLLSYNTCYYTNKKFEEEGPNARSFDRVDSAKGYIEGNVVACTIDINGKKSNLTFEEVECIYKKIINHKSKSAKSEIREVSEVTEIKIEPMLDQQDGYIANNGTDQEV
jgi:hypothetical protein